MTRRFHRWDGTTPSERFWAKVDKESSEKGCWLWTAGLLQRRGYGQFTINGVPISPHRFAYEELKGPIPSGLSLDHLCRVRHCVNPDHLEPVTTRVNLIRGESPAALNAAKTHCPAGHPYDVANTYRMPNGGRDCRECRRTRKAKYLAKKRTPAA